MTEFEIKHGLSQDAPGPLEPVAVAASPVSTVEQRGVQDELTRDRIEEIAREVYKVERFTKDDEVWHNLFWLTSFAKAIEKELRPAPAAGDAQPDAAPEWSTCENRGPWARNSLKAVIDLLRGKETRARHAFTKDYMGLPACYIADAYGEAAAVVEFKLSAIDAQRKGDA